MGPASLSVLTSAAVDALVPLHFQLPPMRYFLPSKAACGAPGGPPAPKKACIFDCGARAARSRGDSGRAPRGRGRAGPTWPPDPLAWLGSASGAAPLSSRARPGKKSVARVINTGAHDERSHGVKRGRRAVCERLVERCAAWQLDVAKAARPAPQGATSAHLDATLLFDRSCTCRPGYARPPRRCAASSGRPWEAASRAPTAARLATTAGSRAARRGLLLCYFLGRAPVAGVAHLPPRMVVASSWRR